MNLFNSACVPSTRVWEFYLSTKFSYTLLTVLYSVVSGLCFIHEVATQLPVKAFICVDWNSYKTMHAVDKNTKPYLVSFKLLFMRFNDMVWCCTGHLGLWYCFKRGRYKTCLSPQLYKLAGIIPCWPHSKWNKESNQSDLCFMSYTSHCHGW